MPRPIALELKASSAETTDGSSAAFDLLDTAWATDELPRRLAELMLEVTAISGTGAVLTVTVQTAPNPSSWLDVLSFKAHDAVGYQRLKFSPLERNVRVVWELEGAGASATFKVAGVAHVIYADQEDFYLYGLPQRATVLNEDEPPDLLAAALLAASSSANAKIPRAYTLPLQPPYPESLRFHVSKLAAWSFLTQRGYDPDSPADKEVKDAAEDAEEWLDGLGGGVEPDWVDATPDVYDAGAGTASGPRRDWCV